MKIAHQLELKIPDNLKIIGYDGTSFIENFFPQLTTIRQPIDEIASLIVDVLLKKIKGEKASKDYILPISLLPGGNIKLKSPTITKIAGDLLISIENRASNLYLFIILRQIGSTSH